MRIRSLNHSRYQIVYHIVWGTRYRRKYIKEYTKLELRKYLYSATKKYPTLSWVGPPLSNAYAQAGENAKLADLLLEQLHEIRKKLPKDSPQLAGLLAQIGLGLWSAGLWS